MKMYRTISFFVMVSSVTFLFIGCQPSQVSAPPVVTEKVPEVDSVAPAPVVEVEASGHDFGQMGPGAKGKCEFKFANTGSETLIIERVQSTCGCTVPQLKKKEYAPGESGVINVSFKAPTVKGKVNKHLYIVSNDPQNPRTKLSINAEVVVKVSISPENVDLRLDQDNAGMPNLVIKSFDDQEFSIQSITIPRGVMKIAFDPAKKAKEFTLEPQVNVEMLDQSTTGVLQVKTDHPQAGTLMVRYNATPRYEVSRPRIILQNVEPGTPVVKDVLIRSNYGTSVEIVSVESKNGYMQIESQEKDNEHLKLQINITPPDQTTSKRYITDELNIVLKDGTNLTIRCSGWFKIK